MRGRAVLRAANAVAAAAIIAILLVHAVGNGLQLIGIGPVLPQALAWVMLALVGFHAVAGIVLTADALRTQDEAPASYPGVNKRFWAVRISGILLLVLIAFHIVVFGNFSDGPFRLKPFAELELAMHIALAVTLAVHAACNAQPLLISLGLPQPKARAIDIAIAVCLIFAFAVAAFAVYYLRWSIV